MTNFDLVREFHERFGHPVADAPGFPSAKLRDLRLKLLCEEHMELEEAEVGDDLVGTADALTDLLYVIYGMGHVYGIDLDACFAEVHRSNMSKLGGDGKPVVRADGKILKGPSYSPPDLAKVMGLINP